MKIVTYDGQSHEDIWSSPYANQINGTDSFGFAPLQFNSTELEVFIDLVCRSAKLDFIEEKLWRRKYQLSFDAFSDSDFCIGTRALIGQIKFQI